MFFKKHQSKQLKAKIKEYKDSFLKYLDSCNDECELNLIFTEFTLFRAKYDIKDSFIQNIKDYLKRKKSISRNDWIRSQLEDILDNFTDDDSEYDREFNDLMNRIIPSDKRTSGWDVFWNWLSSCFDKAAGKK